MYKLYASLTSSHCIVMTCAFHDMKMMGVWFTLPNSTCGLSSLFSKHSVLQQSSDKYVDTVFLWNSALTPVGQCCDIFGFCTFDFPCHYVRKKPRIKFLRSLSSIFLELIQSIYQITSGMVCSSVVGFSWRKCGTYCLYCAFI